MSYYVARICVNPYPVMASRSSSGGRVAAVGKLIKEAQTRDVNGDDLGAYLHYLGCVQYMVQTLSNARESAQGALPPQHTFQLFTLAKNCLERAESIYTTVQREGRNFDTVRRSPQLHKAATIDATDSVNQPRVGESSSTIEHLPPFRTLSTPGRPDSLISPSADKPVVTGSGPRRERYPSQPVVPLHHLSYMDEAHMKNRHMMEQYKAYLRQSSTRMLPPGVGLSMLRRLEENVSVARIREQTVTRRLRERELRIRHETESKRNHVTLSSLSVEELCRQVSAFEHGKQNLNALKCKLENSTDSPHISNFINEILNIGDHPLSRLLGECQFSVYQLLKPVGIAVEKAGGLPRLEIRLANSQIDSVANSSQSSAVHIPSSAKDDGHLDLLEVDKHLLFSSSDPTSSQKNSSLADPMEDKLERLRSSLLAEVAERESQDSGSSGGGSQQLDEASRNSGGAYNQGEASGSESGSRTSDTGPTPTYINILDLPGYVNTNSTPDTEAPQTNNESLYDNSDEIASYLKEHGISEPLPDHHLYDTVFLPDSGHVTRDMTPSNHTEMVGEDLPDGGMFSKPGGRRSDPPAVEEPSVVFKNLPPLTCSIKTGDERMLNELVITARSVLKDVVKLIHSSLQKLEQAFVACYPSLASESKREICEMMVEALFFPAILPPLLMVYRCKNYQEELATAKNMCCHANVTPKDLSVRRKFWLAEQAHAPYGEAIDELRHLSSLQCPSPKLECLVNMSKRIIQCIDSYHEAHKSKGTVDYGVGVDDILPILTYIIIRSGLPQLVSECSMMEEFIHEGYMKGEEGFCLTSFRTALRFVLHMSS